MLRACLVWCRILSGPSGVGWWFLLGSASHWRSRATKAPKRDERRESVFHSFFFSNLFFFFPSKCVCVCGFLASWARSSCYISELFWRTTTATTLRCCWRIRCIILDERLFLSLSLISRAADDYCNNKPFGNLRPPAEGVGSERTWREETTSHAR